MNLDTVSIQNLSLPVEYKEAIRFFNEQTNVHSYRDFIQNTPLDTTEKIRQFVCLDDVWASVDSGVSWMRDNARDIRGRVHARLIREANENEDPNIQDIVKQYLVLIEELHNSWEYQHG